MAKLKDTASNEFAILAAASQVSQDYRLRIIVMGYESISEQINQLKKSKDKQGAVLSTSWNNAMESELGGLLLVKDSFDEILREIESGQERLPIGVDAT